MHTKLLLLVFLLCCVDCHQWVNNPYRMAQDLIDKCPTGTVCCYPTSESTYMCVASSGSFNSVIISIKVLEK